MPSYEFNPAAETVAERLIDEWHPHLRGIKIAYVFKGEETDAVHVPTKSGKSIKYAQAGLVPEKYQLLADQDYKFIIEFSRPIWDRLTLQHQEALIDHELCHCRNTPEDGCYMADHDVEEFRQILVRHGFWRESLRLFIESAQPLFDQPGVQMTLRTPQAGAVSVAYGETVRVIETGEVWCYDPKAREFVLVDSPTEPATTAATERPTA